MPASSVAATQSLEANTRSKKTASPPAQETHCLLHKKSSKAVDFTSASRPKSTPRTGCEIAWNKDPAFGVICIQSSRVASLILGGRDWNAGCGNDRQDSPGVFRSEEVDQGDLSGPARVTKGRAENHPLGCDRVPLRTLIAAASQNRALPGSAELPAAGELR